jgi:probable F420-dependent oxidoreductase
MKVDAGLMASLEDVPKLARELEAQGFDGGITAELANDVFFPLVLAAEHTERIDLITSIAVAFSRSPMQMANIANDLQAYSNGRFILGIGSQIRPHITKRFSMPWSKPAARMREYILAMRAIWACWYEGEPLAFEGEFYTHTLMTPMFTPNNNPHGAPPVILAAVGPKMAEVAGEVADGLLVHSFTTEPYLREVSIPAVEKGLAKAGRQREGFQVSYPPFIVTGRNETEREESRVGVTRQLAFYASTPAYRPVLEMHGWGELQTELNIMSKRGEWVEMGERISDDVLDAFAIVAEPDEVAGKVKERFGGLADRVTCNFPQATPEARREYIETLHSA